MELRFASRKLEACYRESRQAAREWGPVVRRAYVMRLTLLKSPPAFTHVQRFAQFRPHPLKGPRAGEWAIELQGRWRLIVTPVPGEDAVIIEEVSNHYGE